MPRDLTLDRAKTTLTVAVALVIACAPAVASAQTPPTAPSAVSSASTAAPAQASAPAAPPASAGVVEGAAAPATAEPGAAPAAPEAAAPASPEAAAPSAEPVPPPTPPPLAPSPVAAPPAPPAPHAEALPPDAKASAAPARSWIGAGLALGVLNLPKLGAGLQVIGELRSANFIPIDIAAVYWFDNHADLTQDELDLRANPLIGVSFPRGGSRFRVNAVQVSVAACPYERNLSPGSVMLCAGVQGGSVRVRGEGFASTQERNRGLFGFEGYARWHFDLSESVGVSYSAGLFVALMRDRFGYTDRFGHFTDKFRSAPVGGRLDISLTYGF